MYVVSEDLKDELKRVKEELASIKEQLKDVADRERPRHRGFHIDFGNDFANYMDDMMHSVAEGVQGELEKSIFIGPHGMRIISHREPHAEQTEEPVDFAKMADAMSALANEHRLKILKELMSGGRYINELQEKLPEITTSTLSSHLDSLERVGLVVQEKVRGRYLITIPGRTAFTMGTQIMKFLQRGTEQ